MTPPARRHALLVPIATERLTLAPIDAAHADGMFEILSDRRLYRYMLSEAPASLASLKARYARLSTGRAPDDSAHWLNWIDEWSGRPIGSVQATVDRSKCEATMGWTIGTAFQRRGFAREAVGAACEHLAGAGIERFRAVIDVRNEPSIRLAESLGFRRVAVVSSDDVIDGFRSQDAVYLRDR
jgi:ribosomal-protein-alanine N-acetyltransferase